MATSFGSDCLPEERVEKLEIEVSMNSAGQPLAFRDQKTDIGIGLTSAICLMSKNTMNWLKA